MAIKAAVDSSENDLQIMNSIHLVVLDEVKVVLRGTPRSSLVLIEPPGLVVFSFFKSILSFCVHI